MNISEAEIFNARLLIVDGEEALILLLAQMLRNAGYTAVSTTLSSQDACVMHSKSQYDLIFLDLNMPGMSGYEVMEGLKKIDTGAYLSVLAASADPGQRQRALQAGAKDFINKPIDFIELQTRIYNLIELRLLYKNAEYSDRMYERNAKDNAITRYQNEALFNKVASNISEAILILDASGTTVRFVNPAWSDITGRHVVAGDDIIKLSTAIYPDDMQHLRREVMKYPQGGAEVNFRILRPDQSIRWVHATTFAIEDSSGNIVRLAAIMGDITERRETEQRLLRLAHYDTLTGLPNRTLFYELLKKALSQVEEPGLNVSVLFVDLNYFNNGHAPLGRASEDTLLVQAGIRLTRCLRIRDTVGRLGDDKFGLILVSTEDPASAGVVANKVLTILRQPYDLDGREMQLSASIGIAVYPGDSSDTDTLIQYAESASMLANNAGRETFRFHTEKMNAYALEKQALEVALRVAVERNEFTLHYQPKLHMDSGLCCGLEALLRWNRPGYGFVSPTEFVPILEETGMMLSVGRWVIETVCQQIAAWNKSGAAPMQVSLNASEKQFFQDGFVAHIASTIKKFDISPDLLEVEITESVLMTHAVNADEILHQLKALNIGISIDDFGTGYSNLAYLKIFPIDKLKIDMAFIRDLTTNANDAAVTLAIINMAHNLKLKVIAEGGESQEQVDYLRTQGCDELQGFYYSQPLPPAQVEEFRRNAPVWQH